MCVKNVPFFLFQTITVHFLHLGPWHWLDYFDRQLWKFNPGENIFGTFISLITLSHTFLQIKFLTWSWIIRGEKSDGLDKTFWISVVNVNNKLSFKSPKNILHLLIGMLTPPRSKYLPILPGNGIIVGIKINFFSSKQFDWHILLVRLSSNELTSARNETRFQNTLTNTLFYKYPIFLNL